MGVFRRAWFTPLAALAVALAAFAMGDASFAPASATDSFFDVSAQNTDAFTGMDRLSLDDALVAGQRRLMQTNSVLDDARRRMRQMRSGTDGSAAAAAPTPAPAPPVTPVTPVTPAFTPPPPPPPVVPAGPPKNRKVEFQIHVVPHSHTDAGWIMSYHDYYNRRVRTIITTVVETLYLDEVLRFIWADVGFFAVWWQEAPSELRAKAKAIVDRGQMEFVNGGFVMNDEANVNYAQFLDQMSLGHRFIKQTLNTTAQYGWCIDPFGASSSQATMYAQMGMKAVVHARIDERMKKMQMNGTNTGDLTSAGLSFVWRANPAQHGVGSDIYTHIMPNGYTAANHLHWETEPSPGSRRPWKDVALQSDSDKVYVFRTMMQDMAIYIKSMRTPHAILPWGSDFSFTNSRNMFTNMRQLITLLNNPNPQTCQGLCTEEGLTSTMDLPLMEDVLPPVLPGQNKAVDVVMKFRFSTLDEYFSAVHGFAYNFYKPEGAGAPTAGPRGAVTRTLTSFWAAPGTANAGLAGDAPVSRPGYVTFRRGFPGWPVYSSEDLFPYADEYWRPPPNRLRWWTGYFASRPALKQFERRQYRSLRAAEAAMALAPGEGSLDVLPGVVPNSAAAVPGSPDWTAASADAGGAGVTDQTASRRVGVFTSFSGSNYPYAAPSTTSAASAKMSQCAWVSPRARSLLAVARDIMAVMQHHDAITGTSPARTILDYHHRMVRGHAAGVELLFGAVARMLNTPSQLAATPAQFAEALTAAVASYTGGAITATTPEVQALLQAARAVPVAPSGANGGDSNNDNLFFSPVLSQTGTSCAAHPVNGYAARVPEVVPVAVYNPVAWEVPGQVLLLRNVTTRDVVVTDSNGDVLDADVVPVELMEQDTSSARAVLSMANPLAPPVGATGQPAETTADWLRTYTPRTAASTAACVTPGAATPTGLFNVFVQLRKPLPALGAEVLTLYLNTHREPCCLIADMQRAGALDYARPPAFYQPQPGQASAGTPMQTPVFAATAYAQWAAVQPWEVDGASCFQSIANDGVLVDFVGKCPDNLRKYVAIGVHGSSITTNVTATTAGVSVAAGAGGAVTEPFDVSFPYYVPHNIESDGVYTLHINGDPVNNNGVLSPPQNLGRAKSAEYSVAETKAIVYKGRVVQGFTQFADSSSAFPFIHSFRALRGGAGLDGGLQVMPLTRAQNQMLRFHTSIDNTVVLDGTSKLHGLPADGNATSTRRAMYNDDLGLQMQRHFSDPTTNDAGSFYPFISRVAFRDEFPQTLQAHPKPLRGHRQLVIVAQQGAGTSTPDKGQLEVMVNRFSDRDDELGMGEPLRDSSTFTFTYRVYFNAFVEATMASPEDAYVAATSAILFGAKAGSDGACGNDNFHAESILVNNPPFVAPAPGVPAAYALAAADAVAGRPTPAPGALAALPPLTAADPLVSRLALTLASVAAVSAARQAASGAAPAVTPANDAVAPLLRFSPLAQPLPRCVHALTVAPMCDVFTNAIRDSTDPVLPRWPAPLGFNDYSDAVAAVVPAEFAARGVVVRAERPVAGFPLPASLAPPASGPVPTAPPPLPVALRFINLDSRAIFRSSINSKALDERFAQLRPAGAANGVLTSGTAIANLPLSAPASVPLQAAFAFDLAAPVAAGTAAGATGGAGLILRGAPQRVGLNHVAYALSPSAKPATATVVPLDASALTGASPAAADASDALFTLTDSVALAAHTVAPFCPLYPARTDIEIGRLGFAIPARRQPVLQPYARETPTRAGAAVSASGKGLITLPGSGSGPRVPAGVTAALAGFSANPRRAMFYSGASVFEAFSRHLDSKLGWDAGSANTGGDALGQCTAHLYTGSGVPGLPLTLAANNPTLSRAASAGFSTVQRLRAFSPRALGLPLYHPVKSVDDGASWPNAANESAPVTQYMLPSTTALYDASASSYFAPLPWCHCGYQHLVEPASALVLRPGALAVHTAAASAALASVEFAWYAGPTRSAIVASTASAAAGHGAQMSRYVAAPGSTAPTFNAAETEAVRALYLSAEADAVLTVADRGESALLPPAAGSRALPVVSSATSSWVQTLAPLHFSAHTINVDKTAAAGGRGATAAAATLGQIARPAVAVATPVATPAPVPAKSTPAAPATPATPAAPAAPVPATPAVPATVATPATPATVVPATPATVAAPAPATSAVPQVPAATVIDPNAAAAAGLSTDGSSYVSVTTVTDQRSPDGAVVIRVDKLFVQMLVVGGLLSLVGVLVCVLCLLVRAIPRRPGQALSLGLVLAYLRGDPSVGYSRVDLSAAAGGDIAMRGLKSVPRARGAVGGDTDYDDATDFGDETNLPSAQAGPGISRRAMRI